MLRQARQRRHASTTARRRRRRCCRRSNEIIWGSLAFLVLLVAMWKFGVPAVKNMEQAREDRIRNDLEGAEQARCRRRGREGAVPRADRRRQGRGRPDHRGGPPVGRAGARATSSRGPRPRRTRSASGRRPTSRRSSNAGDGRAAHRRGVSSRSTSRSASSSATSTATRNRSSSTASSTRSGATDRWPIASTSTRRRCSTSSRPKATSTRSKTSCSASRGSSRATTTCAWRSRNPGLPLDRRAAIVDELLENRALPITRAIATFIVGAGRGHDLPAIVDRFVELAAQSREHEVAEVRSAVALDDAQQRTARRPRSSRSTGKQVEVKVIVDESVLGGHRRHDRRHGDRRHGPSPPRPAEGEDLMAELTIDAADIAAVLRKNVEGFQPVDRERAGRSGARGRRRHRACRRAARTRRSTSCSSSRAARSAWR